MLYRFLIDSADASDSKVDFFLKEAHLLGFDSICDLECHLLYFVQGNLSPSSHQQLHTLLQTSFSEAGESKRQAHAKFTYRIETVLRPGVTDSTAEQILRAVKLLSIVDIENLATGQQFIIHSSSMLAEQQLHQLAQRLLANAVTHHYVLGEIHSVSFPTTTASVHVENIGMRELTDQALSDLSSERRAALDLMEMKAIQNYYREQQRDPTDVEFEMLAQTWSEHCSHKTFRADIQCKDQTVHGLLNTYIRAATETIQAPWVVSAFVDNAGIIEFDEDYQVAFKVETHNHPSAIEPFGGAHTGLGGVIRDVLGVSAKPIASTDVFCFGKQAIDLSRPKVFQHMGRRAKVGTRGVYEGIHEHEHTEAEHRQMLKDEGSALPAGALHPDLIQSGVVAGVQDYGNKMGIPTVNGAIFYDEGYLANPLVFCGSVGLIPKDKHPCQAKLDDRLIVLGGRTGRDGLRGATFSSMTMDAQTGEVAGASVQIGNPIVEKGLIEVVTRARDLNLYHAITDCGAGGLSSAVGEMTAATGADVDLIHVKLKYAGLTPWEIWLSEAQERMVLAVPASKISALQQLCDRYDTELTDIGVVTATHQLIVRYDKKIVLQLDQDFLFEGRPKKLFSLDVNLSEIFDQQMNCSHNAGHPRKLYGGQIDIHAMLLKLLAHPNIASKAEVIRRYDHEVQGGTVVKPLTGINNDGPSDACVIKPQGSKGLAGLVLANGINPEFGKHNPYRMAVSVIDEAVRNAVAVGADPDRVAILDNFCWGDPQEPETLVDLIACARGCYEAAIHYRTPFISGKDSLNNAYLTPDGKRHAIPGTLLISALGKIQDINQAVTMDFKQAGNTIYLLGETHHHFAGSHFNLCGGLIENSSVPDLPRQAPLLYRCLHRAIQRRFVKSCHDLSEGGLAVAAAEMCVAGRIGCTLNLESDDLICALFSESNGRLLVEVAPEQEALFEALFDADLQNSVTKIGCVTDAPMLVINSQRWGVEQLVQTWLRV